LAQVSFDSVAKRFGNVEALSDFSLEIADKEFMVLVGPSGSGKTTALRMVAGLEAVTSGSIMIDGRRVNDLAPGERDIAMVFQNYALYPHMTVYNNLSYSLRMHKSPKAEIDTRVRSTAGMLDIASLLHRKPAQLSGGQRQRVALGRALVREPAVFLMDEPLSNLDANLRLQTRGEIKQLQMRVGITTVYVTHDQVEAMTMGDRIAVMNNGRIEQVGDPSSIYREPVNKFVAGFLGSPPMAFGRFSVVGCCEGGTKLRSGTVEVEIPFGGPLPSEVTLGVRPEHARLWDEGRKLIGPIDGRISFVESLGRETFVAVEAAESARFVIQVEGQHSVRIADSLRFGLVAGGIYLFDVQSGQTIGCA
jgi:ABC-type sugar transport system ATPase subunit